MRGHRRLIVDVVGKSNKDILDRLDVIKKCITRGLYQSQSKHYKLSLSKEPLSRVLNGK
jgi:hypothetical protein